MMKYQSAFFAVTVFVFGILTSAHLAFSQDDVVLYWYQFPFKFTDSKAESRGVLLCARRNDSVYPTLLYQKTDRKYVPVPLSPSTGDPQRDKQQMNQAVLPFKHSFVGTDDPNKFRAGLKAIQKALGIAVDGDWGSGTWTALIEYLDRQKETSLSLSSQNLRVVNLTKIDLKVEEGTEELRQVLNPQEFAQIRMYNPEQMTSFAQELVSAYETYKKSLLKIDHREPSVQTTTAKGPETLPNKVTPSKKQDTSSQITSTSTSPFTELNPKFVYGLLLVSVISLLITVFLLLSIRAKLSVQHDKIERLRQSQKLKPSKQQLPYGIQRNLQKIPELVKIQRENQENFETFGNYVVKEFQELKSLLTKQFDAESVGTSVSSKPDYFNQGEEIKQSAKEEVQQLAQAYADGYGIELEDYGEPSLALFNQMTLQVTAWLKEVEQSGSHPQLAQILRNVEDRLRRELCQIRGDSVPLTAFSAFNHALKPEDVDEIRQKCENYVKEFKVKLAEYERRCAPKASDGKYEEFFYDLIVNQFFDGVTKLFQHDALPEPLHRILGLVGYEVMPIQIGRTKVDSRLHKIQRTQHAPDARGLVVKVVSPGLRSQKDKSRIVRPPVVIRGE